MGRYSYQRKYEYAAKLAQEKGGNVSNIPLQPPTITDEIVIFATRISEIFLSSSKYPQNYLEIMSCSVTTMLSFSYIYLNKVMISKSYLVWSTTVIFFLFKSYNRFLAKMSKTNYCVFCNVYRVPMTSNSNAKNQASLAQREVCTRESIDQRPFHQYEPINARFQFTIFV